MQHEPLIDIRVPKPSEDILLRYIPLRNTTGISVAFSTGDLLAVISHTAEKHDLSVYTELGVHAVWTHCPLSNEDNITEVWGVYHSMTYLKMCSLVVSYTTYALVPGLTEE